MPENGGVAVKVENCHFDFKEVCLSLLERLQLKLTGYAYLFHAQKEGWKGKLPFYIVKCKRCNFYFIDYPHGYSRYFLCPKCVRRETEK